MKRNMPQGHTTNLKLLAHLGGPSRAAAIHEIMFHSTFTVDKSMQRV